MCPDFDKKLFSEYCRKQERCQNAKFKKGTLKIRCDGIKLYPYIEDIDKLTDNTTTKKEKINEESN